MLNNITFIVTRIIIINLVSLFIPFQVVCDPPCDNGACIANDTCNCAQGYTGETCSEIGRSQTVWFNKRLQLNAMCAVDTLHYGNFNSNYQTHYVPMDKLEKHAENNTLHCKHSISGVDNLVRY